MPKSKRAKTVHTSRATKKDRAHKLELFANVQEAVHRYPYAYVVNVENMRNKSLQEVRAGLKGSSRIFFGKNKIVAKALGDDADSEIEGGISKLAKHLHGPLGLIFSTHPPPTLLPQLETYTAIDYARTGASSPVTFILPAGTIYSRGGELPISEDVPLPHSMEAGLRALGVPSRLNRGKVELDNEYTVCREGEVLDSRQARLLKMFGVAVAEFRVGVVAHWSKETGQVVEVDKMEE